LRLQQVWLVVSPGNPLKPARGMAGFADRLASARAVADGRRIVATDLEWRLGTRYTIDTIRQLRQLFPRATFLWLMGADNLVQLPHWRRWLEIVKTTAFAVMPRPTYNHRALAGLAARRLRCVRHPAPAAFTLAGPPAWVFLPCTQHDASASAIRAARSGVQDHRQKAAA
jgi:nicotinate-nucleotide adenylyltransferase